MVSLITAYMVGLNIRHELEGVAKPRFIFLMLFTAPGAIVFAGSVRGLFRAAGRTDSGV